MRQKEIDEYFQPNLSQASLKTAAIRGGSITLITQVFVFTIGIAGSIALARLLMPSDFGLVAMVLAISLLLQNFGPNGFTEAAVQVDKLTHAQLSNLFWTNVGLNGALCLIFVSLTPVIVAFYHEPLVSPIVIAMSSTILLGGLYNQHISLLIRNMEFLKLSIAQAIAAVGSVVIAVSMAWIGYGYWALVAKWISSPLLLAICSWAFCKWRPSLPCKNVVIRPLIMYSLRTYGHFMINYCHRNLARVIVGRLWDSNILGLYDRAYFLSTMLPNQTVQPLANVALSTFSKLTDNPIKYRMTYLRLLSLISTIVMPLSAVTALVGKDVIVFLLGKHWADSGQIFVVLALSTGPSALYLTHIWLHLSLGTPKRLVRWSILALATTALLFAFGFPFGVLGIAGGFSASFYILLFPALVYAGSPVGLGLMDVISVVWKHFLAALCAGIICLYFLYFWESGATSFSKIDAFLRIMMGTGLCLIIHLLILLLVFRGKETLREVMAVAREVIKKDNKRA